MALTTIRVPTNIKIDELNVHVDADEDKDIVGDERRKLIRFRNFRFSDETDWLWTTAVPRATSSSSASPTSLWSEKSSAQLHSSHSSPASLHS